MDHIVNNMERFIRATEPRISNPVDPEEDFTDRWNAKLERNFRSWLEQVKQDYAHFGKGLSKEELNEAIQAKFNVTVSHETLRAASVPKQDYEPPLVNVSGAPKSWTADD
ncbi:hypothetical protein D6833_12430 [Candidatus Parcubacteria bacterium]|nr:MAG: hypothetical protein D6833_12430 [Candidatus Parcubacteria bacterium]